jgi:hypothetical protein
LGKMKLHSDFKINATITISCEEAEILHEVVSYSLLKWFSETCTKRFEIEDLNNTLSRLRSLTERIIQARERARQVVENS